MHRTKTLIEKAEWEQALCGFCFVIEGDLYHRGPARSADTYIVTVFDLPPKLKRFLSSEAAGEQEV